MKLDKLATARILKEVHHYESMYHKGAQERSCDCLLRGEGDLRLKVESWKELGDPRNRVQKHCRVLKE